MLVLDTGYWILVSGFWFLVSGFWFLVFLPVQRSGLRRLYGEFSGT
jgi:hypothetical protein